MFVTHKCSWSKEVVKGWSWPKTFRAKRGKPNRLFVTIWIFWGEFCVQIANIFAFKFADILRRILRLNLQAFLRINLRTFLRANFMIFWDEILRSNLQAFLRANLRTFLRVNFMIFWDEILRSDCEYFCVKICRHFKTNFACKIARIFARQFWALIKLPGVFFSLKF